MFINVFLSLFLSNKKDTDIKETQTVYYDSNHINESYRVESLVDIDEICKQPEIIKETSVHYKYKSSEFTLSPFENNHYQLTCIRIKRVILELCFLN